MSEYVLSCCSTADLTKEHLEKRNIKYVCFHYALNDKEYFDDLGESMPFDEFYQAMKDGADTRTSQINTDEYIDYFEPFLEQGLDILHLTLSSGLSGTINSAKIAQIMLKEKYPNRKILVDLLRVPRLPKKEAVWQKLHESSWKARQASRLFRQQRQATICCHQRTMRRNRNYDTTIRYI